MHRIQTDFSTSRANAVLKSHATNDNKKQISSITSMRKMYQLLSVNFLKKLLNIHLSSCRHIQRQLFLMEKNPKCIY